MTNQNVSRLHVRPFAVAALLAAAVCASIQPASAFRATSSIRVDFSGIDLSTSAGQEIAKQRLIKAARLTCFRVEEPQDLSRHENYVACVSSTLAQAMPKLAQLIANRSSVQMAGNAPK